MQEKAIRSLYNSKQTGVLLHAFVTNSPPGVEYPFTICRSKYPEEGCQA